mmetsp:Transcript_38520/g.90418  ORF Transcript_38520/g.90418 Transcript_38520/m.90418 type:complete len:291 (+) Transcript_38520:52-924(+)
MDGPFVRHRRMRLLGDLGLGEVGAHGIDGGLVRVLVARGLEDGRASDDHVHARLRHRLDVVDVDAAVDLEADVETRFIDHLAGLTRLHEGVLDELLPAEARVDGHEEDDVDLVHHVLAHAEVGGGVEHETSLAPTLADEGEGAVDVVGRLRVEGDVRRAGRDEVGDDRVDRRNHEVNVDGRGDAVVAERLAHHRADGEVRDVVVVHNVEVDHVRARREHRVNLSAELGEVGREDGGGDEEVLAAPHHRGRGAPRDAGRRPARAQRHRAARGEGGGGGEARGDEERAKESH